MLADPLFAKRAELVAHRLRQQDGARAAVNALEELYRKTRKAK
jgi:UDP:flavonoid glycosyltransferase YjiC (YdhE family)